jgi:hypothetical protein
MKSEAIVIGAGAQHRHEGEIKSTMQTGRRRHSSFPKREIAAWALHLTELSLLIYTYIGIILKISFFQINSRSAPNPEADHDRRRQVICHSCGFRLARLLQLAAVRCECSENSARSELTRSPCRRLEFTFVHRTIFCAKTAHWLPRWRRESVAKSRC